MSKEIRSYPKVYNLGHKAVDGVLDGTTVIQEKYDGSQFSWAWIDGVLFARSKGTMQAGPSYSTDKMFAQGVEYLESLEPIEGYIFRGEYFAKPKHNTLAYPRMPSNHFILYDVERIDSDQAFHHDGVVAEMAGALDIEPAQYFTLVDPSFEDLKDLLEEESSLGGPIEGIVIKNYAKTALDGRGKTMMAKLVSKDFREKHDKSWKARNPNSKDIIQNIVAQLNTERRWEKAVEHLRDDGKLQQAPQDIGPLMKEVKQDTIEEERDWIVQQLLDYALPKISKGLGRGLPEWYKERLAKEAMKETA